MADQDSSVVRAVEYARDLLSRDGGLRGDVAVLAQTVDDLATALRDAYGCLCWQAYGLQDGSEKQEGVIRAIDRLRPLVPTHDRIR